MFQLRTLEKAFTDICEITEARPAINICTKFLRSTELDGMRRNYSVKSILTGQRCFVFDLSPYCLMDITDAGDDNIDDNDRLSLSC